MNYAYLIFAFLIGVSTFAQEFDITGKVVDDQGFELEMASVSIINPANDNVVDGGITDMEGKFMLEAPQGIYTLKIEFISFEPRVFKNVKVDQNLDFGTIELQSQVDVLDEVNVVAEKTEVEVKLDKRIYNIGKDLTISGGTVSDALNNVPSVSADVDGTISLRGNENVRILINGKPSTLAGFGDQDVLQQLPAEAIERVEVISSPSARYDAEGTAGIINIILKRDRTLGFNGSAQLTTGTPLNNGVTLNGNLRTEKFNIFSTLTYARRKPPGNAQFDNTFTSGSFDRIVEDRQYNRDIENFSINAGAEYFISDEESITYSIYARPGNREYLNENLTDRFIGNEFDSSTLREELEDRSDNRYQTSVNYRKIFDKDNRDHKLEVDAQVSWRNRDEEVNIVENQFTIQGEDDFLLAQEQIFDKRNEIGYLIQADYVRPVGENGQFEAGFRGDYNDNRTRFELFLGEEENPSNLIQDNLSNIFNYNENVTASYVQYGDKIGDNFSFLLGLRYEYTQLKGQTTPLLDDLSSLEQFYPDGEVETDFDNRFSNFFPTVNLIYELPDESEVTLGYNRRINRPRNWFINPFPSRTSRTNIFQGNPSLRPAFADAVDLGYLKKWDKVTLTGSVYYQREEDSFERIQEDLGIITQDGINVIINRPINLSVNERIGGELGVLYNPAKKIRFNGSFNYFRFESRGEFRGVDFGATNLSWFGRLSSRVELPWGINWQTNGFYRGPLENAQTKTDPILSLDLAFSKDILNDNATISFNVRDVFNSRRRIQSTRALNADGELLFTSENEFQWRVRQITASIVYRFNQQKKRNGKKDGGDFDDDGGF
ncbi:MAG: TonB-dependent receptor [Flavobacteriaceae bacterium]|nr:TonB-dependent receptor [Flavobacteriaceae bacterium]